MCVVGEVGVCSGVGSGKEAGGGKGKWQAAAKLKGGRRSGRQGKRVVAGCVLYAAWWWRCVAGMGNGSKIVGR